MQAVRWRWLLPFLLALAVLIYLRQRRAADKVLWEAHSHEEAQASGLASWRDCTGRAPSGTELKRAYRKLAKEAHPDRHGSNEHFQSLHSAQKQLQNPVQYNLRAALGPSRPGHMAKGHGVHDARLALRKENDGARVHLEVDFTSPVPRGLW